MKSDKISHFLLPDHTEIFRARLWKVYLHVDAAKIIEFRKISFLSYGGYNMKWLNIFNFPKCKFAFSILHSTRDNFGKQT